MTTAWAQTCHLNPRTPQPVPATVPENSNIDLFQRTILLTEAMKRLKSHVNAEKYAHCSNPAHLEDLSSDEEETEVPVLSVPIMSSSLLPLPILATLVPDTSPTLPLLR